MYSILLLKKKWEDEWIYPIQNIKSLLTRKLERFYLSLEDSRELFQNDLYIVLYNKKIYNVFICKILLSN